MNVGLPNLLDSTLMLKAEEEDVVIYYNFHAFNDDLNGRLVVLHLLDASKGES